MIGLFGDPFFGYGAFPSLGMSYHDLKMLNRLQSLFDDDDSDDEQENEKNEQEKPNDDVKKNEEKDVKKDDEKKEAKAENKKADSQSKSYQMFSQFKQDYRKGPNMIEEIRERTCDSATGTVKETTKRRIGDKWCVIEEETNKNGEKITHEKWHNVSKENVDNFKRKWEKHKGKFGFENLSLKGPED